MTIKLNFILFLIVFSTIQASAQNDFSIRWSIYETGETIDENPFAGSFTIKNEGESTIMANDTIWYGYWIEGNPYDLGLNPDLVSGRVLETDFLPGDEIAITNNFFWPPLGSGLTLEICAVVYGEGIASYEDVYFLGDDSIANNTDCLNAVIPVYELSIEDLNHLKRSDLKCYYDQDHIVIVQAGIQAQNTALISLSTINGQIIEAEQFNLMTGHNHFPIPELANGIYILVIQVADKTYSFKISL